MRCLSCGVISLRNDTKEYVIRMTPVGIFLRKHMQAMRMQVGCMRFVYAVDMSTNIPIGTQIVAGDLLNLF